MELGELIRNYCDEHGMSNREFARRSGITASTLTYYFNGKNGSKVSPNSETLNKIAKTMGLLPEELVACLNDEELITVNDNYPLSDNEYQLIQLFRKVPESDQALVLGMIQAALSSKELL